MTHYKSHFDAEKKDEKAIKTILSLDEMGLINAVHLLFYIA
ncbi:MAG: hypothetical protein ACE5Z5_00770 [Candidatus Bathyarchaeia archaeon]